MNFISKKYNDISFIEDIKIIEKADYEKKQRTLRIKNICILVGAGAAAVLTAFGVLGLLQHSGHLSLSRSYSWLNTAIEKVGSLPAFYSMAAAGGLGLIGIMVREHKQAKLYREYWTEQKLLNYDPRTKLDADRKTNLAANQKQT